MPDRTVSDGVIFHGEVTEGHRVVLEFDGGGIAMRLIHPDGGCPASEVCASCAADLTDPESDRCYDCPAGPSEECWLTGWFDNLSAEELLHGKIELPVKATWDQDHPLVVILAPEQPNPVEAEAPDQGPGLTRWEAERLGQIAKYAKDLLDADADLLRQLSQRALASPGEGQVEKLKRLVDRQAEDEGLWFGARNANTAYVQQELRKLHQAIEVAAELSTQPVPASPGEAGEGPGAQLDREVAEAEEIVSWRCECGDLNRGHEAGCYRCGAGKPEDRETAEDYIVAARQKQEA